MPESSPGALERRDADAVHLVLRFLFSHVDPTSSAVLAEEATDKDNLPPQFMASGFLYLLLLTLNPARRAPPRPPTADPASFSDVDPADLIVNPGEKRTLEAAFGGETVAFEATKRIRIDASAAKVTSHE